MEAAGDLWRGVSRHPLKTLGLIYLAFSALFTVVQAVNFFDEKIKFQGIVYLTILIIASVCFALSRVWKPSKTEIKIDHTNTITFLIVSLVSLFQRTVYTGFLSNKHLEGILIASTIK
jgi:hypothetical protein